MELSKAVASLALILGVLLAAGYARGAEKGTKATVQDQLLAREALRRAAFAEHHKRKEDFARLCTKPFMSSTELEACRAAYRRL